MGSVGCLAMTRAFTHTHYSTPAGEFHRPSFKNTSSSWAHTHTHTRMYARTHAHTDSLCLSFLSSGAEVRQRGWRVLRISCSSRSLTDSGARGREARGARRERKEKKKAKRERSTGMCLGCSWTPQKTVIWGGGGAIKGTAFRGLRANIAVPWGLRKEIIQERSEWAETGWKRRTNPGWLGAAGRALFHPDPGETHEDRGEAPGLHVNVSQSTCVSDQRHSYPVLFPR